MTGPISAPSRSVAIVGAGPAGLYTAAALASADEAIAIDILDRLPVPFGLVRYGVAPDHQETKKIQGLLETIMALPQARFFGNVALGGEVSLADLRSLYDCVVLACGAPKDATLGIPGEALPGVLGAAEFVGWYNGHPDHVDLRPAFGEAGVVVIGNGNVAIDIARILSKSPRELAEGDITQAARAAIAASPHREVRIVGRRGPAEARFTTIELSELGDLEQAVAVADAAEIPDEADLSLPARDRRVAAKNLTCLRAFAAADSESRPRRIRFQFNARPIEILGADRVEAVRFERMEKIDGQYQGSGQTFTLPCSVLIKAIGYRAQALDGVEAAGRGDRLKNDDGLIAPGLYVAGWLKRGPSGKIGANRNDGEDVARRIVDEVAPAGGLGRAGLLALLERRGARPVDLDGWKRIEAAEYAAAAPGEIRRKLVSVPAMLDAAANAAGIGPERVINGESPRLEQPG